MNRIRRTFIPFLLLMLSAVTGSAFTSKWEQVDAMAQSLLNGQADNEAEASRRLFIKNQIIEILYEQETDYPIFYVDINASGSQSGDSWGNAFVNIQDGIDAANQAGEGWVWVARGLYRENNVLDSEVLGYYEGAIVIKPGVMVFGGFEGTETYISQRQIGKDITIIQGDIGVYSYGKGGGRRGVDMAHKTLIDGCTVRNSGYVYDPVTENWPFACWVAGGGIKTRSWLSIIRNNFVYNCYAKGGGGLGAFYYDDPKYNQKVEHENIEGYDPIIERNTVFDNSAVCGSGVQLRNSETLFAHNTVAYNRHKGEDAIYTKHKGIEIVQDVSVSDRPVIVNTIAYYNTWQGKYSFNRDIYTHVDINDGYYGFNNCVGRLENWRDYPVNQNSVIIWDAPQFVNPDAFDFTLQSSSPCIGAGLPLPDGSETDIGIYEQRHQVIIDDGGIGAITAGAGLHLMNETVLLSVETPTFDVAGTTKFDFIQWLGEGEGAYTGPNINPEIVVAGDIQETISWSRSFYVEVSSAMNEDLKSGWYSENNQLTLSVPGTVYESDKIRSRFAEWRIGGSSQSTASDSMITVQIDEPKRVVAVWQIEFLVQVASEFGNPTMKGSAWIPEGGSVHVSVDKVVPVQSDTRYRFNGWQGVGDASYTGPDTSYTIRVNSPITETAAWQKEFLLSILTESNQGNVRGNGWYAENTIAEISVDSLIQQDDDHRIRFMGWSAVSGPGMSTSQVQTTFAIKAPIVEQVLWQSEIHVDLSMAPENSGVIESDLTADGWGAAEQAIQLHALGDADAGYGFAVWSGASESKSNPLTMLLQAPIHLTAHFEIGDVRIETHPTGLSILTDGASFESPRIFYWLPGENHTISAPSPQNISTLKRAVFERWSNQQTQTHILQIPNEPLILEADFNVEYALNVQTNHAMSTVKGAGWYHENETVIFSIDSLVDTEDGVRWRFSGWTGAGSGSVSGPKSSSTVKIGKEGIVQTANWQKQYLMNTEISPPYGGSVTFIPAQTWCDSGVTMTLTALPRDTHFTFIGWRGDLESVNPVISVSMEQPCNLTAQFSSTTALPPVVSGFPDVAIYEDTQLKITNEQLQSFIIDPNDPFEYLSIRLNSIEQFTGVFDDHNNWVISPPANWNGVAELVVTATDPLGISGTDTFSMTIMAQPDPPEPFDLISPSHQLIYEEMNGQIEFKWHTAVNVDSGDQIKYVFYFGPDSTFQNPSTFRWPELKDTTLILNSQILINHSYWRVQAVDGQGLSTWSDHCYEIARNGTSVSSSKLLSNQFLLHQNYPNPFNGKTRILYEIPKQTTVTMKILDARGRLIRSYPPSFLEKGQYYVEWEATDQQGLEVATGVYFIAIETEEFTLQRKMVYVR